MTKPCLIPLLAVGLFSSQIQAQDRPVLKTQRDKVSYSIGREMGSGMRQQKLEIDPDLIIAGFRDGISGKTPALSEAESKEVMAKFEKEMESRMAQNAKEVTEKQKKDGEAFLAENKKKEGIKTLPSGLQYKVLKEGAGASPLPDDRVTTHYRGTLLDGTEFDSSYSRNEPASFGVSQVIKGWQEALQLMKPGAKWQLFIPSELAYGDQGAGGVIGPNAALIFDIELLSID